MSFENLKKDRIIFFLSLISFNFKIFTETKINKNIKIIDGTVATAYNPEGNILLKYSDIRPSLDGTQRTLKDLLFQELAVADAKKLHIEVSDQDVDRYLATVQKQTGYSLKQIENGFADLGWTLEEGRDQLKKTNMVQEVVSYRVRQQIQIVVSDEAIKKYHEENPIVIEESYKISQTFFAYNKNKTVEENLEGINNLISSGDIQYAVSWDEPVEFKLSEFTEDQKFITGMNADQIAIFKKTDDGVYLVKLVAKTPEHVVPLEERKEEIEETLKMQAYEDRMKNYEKQLFESSKIRYHDIQIQDPTLLK